MKAGKDLTHEEIVQAQKSIFESMGFWLGEGAVREAQDAMIEMNKGIATNPFLAEEINMKAQATKAIYDPNYNKPLFTPAYNNDPKVTEEYINDIIEICKQLDKP